MAGRLIPSRPRPREPATNNDHGARPVGQISEAKEMLKLMQTVRGRIRGDVLIRRENSDSNAWQPSYVYINVSTGSLRYETPDNDSGFETLVPDLRGCEVYAFPAENSDSNILYIEFQNVGTRYLYLKPQNQKYFTAWFAAILCWRPLEIKENVQDATENERTRPLSLLYPEVFQLPSKQSSDEENMIIKKDKVMMITTDMSASTGNHSSKKISETEVICILRRNSELSIRASGTSTSIATVQLTELPRSSIQRLSESIYGRDRAFAIHPQYAHSADACSRLRPICLSFRSKENYELWFALVRACAVPEMYGLISGNRLALPEEAPQAYENPDFALLRIEHNLLLRINKCILKEKPTRKSTNESSSSKPDSHQRKHQMPANYYAEIAINGQLMARTSVKPGVRGNIFWYENHKFQDLVRVPAAVSFKVKKQNIPNSGRDRRRQPTAEDHAVPTEDSISGELNIDLDSLEMGKLHAMSSPITRTPGGITGEVLFDIEYKRDNILKEKEYKEISDVLHNVSNNLTVRIWKRIPSALDKLSECFLNIFQSTGLANIWLKSLVEEEIHGAQKIDYNKAESFFDSDDNETDQPAAENRSSEVFTLFRGNTLLSRALDSYMKRLGQFYLEETIGNKIQEINNNDLNCEVNPSKLGPQSNISQNWEALLQTTKDIWLQIFGSASSCPTELRMIFQHIQDCARAKYGEYIQSAVYTSVSGFLFLRFFCAAIYSPQLFGLLNNDLKPNACRTFVLVAKSLQGLANKQVDFSRKEPWMAPMNDFCAEYTKQFETFIDSICRITKDEALDVDNWAASGVPILDEVHQRLAEPAREGCLLLPGLVDSTRSFATLVDTWLNNADVDDGDDDAIIGFDRMCRRVRAKVETYSENLDIAAKETGILQKWFKEAENMEAYPYHYWKDAQQVQRDVRASPSPAVPTGPYHERYGYDIKSEGGGKISKRISNPGPQHSPESHSSSDRPTSSRSSNGSGSQKPLKRGKQPSPPRDVQDNALRKLGWM